MGRMTGKIEMQVDYYLLEFVIEKASWQDYERHKKELSKICQGDSRMYEFAIQKLTDRMGL